MVLRNDWPLCVVACVMIAACIAGGVIATNEAVSSLAKVIPTIDLLAGPVVQGLLMSLVVIVGLLVCFMDLRPRWRRMVFIVFFWLLLSAMAFLTAYSACRPWAVTRQCF